MVVAAKFDMAGPFHDGLAQVGDLDPDGTPAVPGIVKRRVGLINTAGDLVTPLCFDYARDFSEGRAAVMVGKKWGFIDRNGVVVIKPQYAAAWAFTEGIARVKKGRLYRMIDPAGEVLFEKAATAIGQCRSGLIPSLAKSMWSYLDRTGATAFQLACRAAGEFSEGMASFLAKDRSRSLGYIDTTGTVVISPQFAQAGDFHEGLAVVDVFNAGQGKQDFTKPNSSGLSTAKGRWRFPRCFALPTGSRKAWRRCGRPKKVCTVISIRRAKS